MVTEMYSMDVLQELDASLIIRLTCQHLPLLILHGVAHGPGAGATLGS